MPQMRLIIVLCLFVTLTHQELKSYCILDFCIKSTILGVLISNEETLGYSVNVPLVIWIILHI